MTWCSPPAPKMGSKEGKSERKARQQAVDNLRCYNHFQGPSVFPAFYILSLLLVLYEEFSQHGCVEIRGAALCTKASCLILSTQLRHLSYILRAESPSGGVSPSPVMGSVELWDPHVGISPCARPGCGEELDRQSMQKKRFSSVSF